MSRQGKLLGKAAGRILLLVLFVVVLTINLLPFVDSQEALMDFAIPVEVLGIPSDPEELQWSPGARTRHSHPLAVPHS